MWPAERTLVQLVTESLVKVRLRDRVRDNDRDMDRAQSRQLPTLILPLPLQ